MQGGASPIPLIPGKISSSFQKKTNRIYARSRKRRTQRMVTTIRQPLNNHWPIIEQPLNKPCSNPSNIRVVLWNETHRFEKPNPVVWGITNPRVHCRAWRSRAWVASCAIWAYRRNARRRACSTLSNGSRRRRFEREEPPFWNMNVHELFMNWTWIDFLNTKRANAQKLMRHLMRQLMGIHGETFLAGSAHFLKHEKKRGRNAPKKQQFWAFFGRFDINIFNFREQFPPRNFAYSARSFSWMRI